MQGLSTAAAPVSVPAPDLAPYQVDDPRECLALLEQLREQGVPVVISSPDGSTLSTALFGIDRPSQRLNFHARSDTRQLEAVVQSSEAMALAYLEKVKLQFDLHDLMLVRGSSTRALQCRIPGEIFRLQRRQAFRVPTLQRHTPAARLRHAAMRDMQLSLRVLDISLGGCSLWLPADVPPLQPGTLLSDVHIELDPQTQFAVELRLRHVSCSGNSDGPNPGVRLGCSWRPVNPAALRTLQRWINQAQKRTRLLSRAEGDSHRA
jgi:flagellar brake protein